MSKQPYPYERNFIHPAVRRWLTERGYKWRHEEVIERGHNYKRPDFLAQHTETGDRLIVECKPDHLNIKAAIRQVIRYRESMGDPNVKIAVAVPQFKLRERIRKHCVDVGVELIIVKPMSHYAHTFWEADYFGVEKTFSRIYEKDTFPFTRTLGELSTVYNESLETLIPRVLQKAQTGHAVREAHEDFQRKVHDLPFGALLYWLYINDYTEVYDSVNRRSVFVKGRSTGFHELCPNCGCLCELKDATACGTCQQKAPVTTIFWRHTGDIAILATIDAANGVQYWPSRRALNPIATPLFTESDNDPVNRLQDPIFTSVSDPLPREEALRWYEEQSAYQPGFGVF